MNWLYKNLWEGVDFQNGNDIWIKKDSVTVTPRKMKNVFYFFFFKCFAGLE